MRAIIVSLFAVAIVACSAPAPSTDGGPVDACALDPSACAPSDPCDPSPCTMAHTRCIAEGASATCLCEGGYHQEAGECVRDSACTDGTCSGHGTCAMTGDPPMPACTCEAGYAGAFCDACDESAGWFPDGAGGCDDDPCDPSPCTEAGRTRCEASGGVATCSCDAGRHDEGGVCVPDRTCTATTCSGHGTCTSEGSGVACACDAGFDGASCERCADGYHDDGAGGCTTDVCTPSPCTEAHRGVCVDDAGTARCDCNAGYHLEGDLCVLDETCTATTCSGHGTCSVVGGRTSCACDASFTGPTCASCDGAAGYHDDGAGGCTIDPCTPNPCTMAGRGVCELDGAGGSRCACDAGLHEDGVGGCTSDPCLPDPCAAMGEACRVVSGAAECYVPMCNDDNPCTDDAYVGGSCTFTPRTNGAACSTSRCMVGGTCSSGVCIGEAPRVCDDGNPCTRDTCDPIAGCGATNDDTLVPDDGIACTIDACAAGAASHTASNAACDDGAWCTGVESCAPASAGADARGCVHGSVPRAPAPDATCRWYECDEGSHSFVRRIASAGTSCSDGLGCTSGDACDGTGACTGTAGASCSTLECSAPGAMPATIDLGIAHVIGSVTLDGGPLPSTQPGSDGDITLYAVARDTGARHILGYVRYRYTSSGVYTLYSTDGTLDTRVLPGVYDILYRRNYDASNDYAYADNRADPLVNGYRLLRSGLVLGPGDNVVNLDLSRAHVTGNITLAMGGLPGTQPGSDGDITLYARARDTGARHILGYIRYRYASGGVYSLYSTDGMLDTRLLAGAYDILYRRNYDASNNYAYADDAADPYVNGYRVLRENVVFTRGDNTLSLDLGRAHVVGDVTLATRSLPMTQPSSDGDITLYAVARDTGARHILGYVRYRYASSGVYTLYSTDGHLDTRLLPGTYDILYRRNYDATNNYAYEDESDDPYVNGYRLLREGVVFSAGDNTLALDLGRAHVTGDITLAGTTLPATQPSSDGDITLYAVARDTGARHILGYIRYRYSSSGVYSLYSTDGTLDTRLLPGTYDILYRRNYDASNNYAYADVASDPYVNGYRLLREGVTFAAGENPPLDLDLGRARVQGSVTLDGAALPTTQPSSDGDITLYAVARDTGARHILGYIRYRYTSSGVYTLYSTDGTLDTRVLPGVYDILYRRNYDASNDYAFADDARDPYVNGYRLLRKDITLNAGMNTLNLDLRRRRVGATVTLAGGALPATQRSSDGDITFYARAVDTRARHILGYVRYRYASGGVYSRYGTDGTIDTRVLEGAYDVIYRRNYDATNNYSYADDPSDPYVNGYRVIAACIAP